MIAVDTSAVVAIAQLETEAPDFRRCIEEAPSVCVSAVSLQEIVMVITARRGDPAIRESLELLLRDLRL